MSLDNLIPDINNVELGDWLIVSKNDMDYDFIQIPITKIDWKYITATNDNKSYYAMLYKEALVLKKDKSLFLIGEEVPENFKQSNLTKNDNPNKNNF